LDPLSSVPSRLYSILEHAISSEPRLVPGDSIVLDGEQSQGARRIARLKRPYLQATRLYFRRRRREINSLAAKPAAKPTMKMPENKSNTPTNMA
jgi:hypothetical protein